MKAIQFHGHEMVLTPSGVLIWPAHKLAVVSDLHLEKGSYFGLSGQFLPTYDSVETLERLRDALQMSGAETVIFLGDSFHDEKGYHRLSDEARGLFDGLIERFDVIWIVGNHDGAFAPAGVHVAEDIAYDSVIFRHEAQADFDSNGLAEISGHFHPKASLSIRGKRVRKACFIEDGQRMIMPAFGAYTGGMNVASPEISGLFAHPARLHLMGQKDIYSAAFEDIKLNVSKK